MGAANYCNPLKVSEPDEPIFYFQNNTTGVTVQYFLIYVENMFDSEHPDVRYLTHMCEGRCAC